MKTRLVLGVAILVALCALLWITFDRRERGTTSTPAARLSETVVASGGTNMSKLTGAASHIDGSDRMPPTPPASSVPPQTSADPMTTPTRAPTLAVPAAAPAGELAIEMDNVRVLIRDYRSACGENPVGSNAEITKALSGANPKKVKFLPAEGMQVNAKGELVDRWGTPYFFHQISGREMEIRSAGPDKKMWTDDDLVIR